MKLRQQIAEPVGVTKCLWIMRSATSGMKMAMMVMMNNTEILLLVMLLSLFIIIIINMTNHVS